MLRTRQSSDWKAVVQLINLLRSSCPEGSGGDGSDSPVCGICRATEGREKSMRRCLSFFSATSLPCSVGQGRLCGTCPLIAAPRGRVSAAHLPTSAPKAPRAPSAPAGRRQREPPRSEPRRGGSGTPSACRCCRRGRGAAAWGRACRFLTLGK